MTILVTGCFGFIGSNLVQKLLLAGHKVVGFDNLSNCSFSAPGRIKSAVGPKWKNFEFYKLDIRELESMHAVCTHHRITQIVHLAAMGSVPRSFLKPAEYVDVNEKGFVNICLLSRLMGMNRIVYASSSSVYGAIEGLRTEEDSCEPTSPYGVSKLQNELFAHTWSRYADIEMIGLRFFNVYGPGQNQHGDYAAVIPRFILEDIPVINGSPEIERDFTYVDDVCLAIGRALTIDLRTPNRVINVGSGVPTTLRRLATLLGKEFTVGPAREGDVKRAYAETALAESVLGHQSITSLETGLALTVKYFKEL